MLADLLTPAKVENMGQQQRRSDGVADDQLSAGEESAGLGHLVAVFALGAEAEGNGSDTNHKGAHDRSVGPPVGWLGVPTTSGGPDFLGVPVRLLLASGGDVRGKNIRDLSTSTHCDEDAIEGVIERGKRA